MSLSRRSLAILAAAAATSAALVALPARSIEIQWGDAQVTTGSGRVATQARAVSGYQAVASRGPIDLVVRQDGREGAEVRGDDNLLPLVETVVETRGGVPTLVVGMRKGHGVTTRNDLVVTVHASRLSAVSTSGSGDVRIEGLQAPSFALSISGSSGVDLGTVRTDELSVAVSGSGDVRGAGRSARLNVSISGSGDVRLPQLQTDEATVKIAGSGDADLAVARQLTVSIAGSGDVRYQGDPKVTSRIAGSGEVAKR